MAAWRWAGPHGEHDVSPRTDLIVGEHAAVDLQRVVIGVGVLRSYGKVGKVLTEVGRGLAQHWLGAGALQHFLEFHRR